jgi:hypothetical protein
LDRTSKIILVVVGVFFLVSFLWAVVAGGLIASFDGPVLPG